MKDRFSDIVDLKFTARMEEELDSVEKGQKDWRGLLQEFYGGFEQSLEDAEKALDGERIKVPDEVSDEVCDVCGRKMVVKTGRFGRFLACPGYPECNFTKPLVIEMPGRCPRCGKRILKRTSRNGYTYYACENLKTCGFITWDVPVKDDCPQCGWTMFKRSGRGYRKPFCINPDCANFTPEDKRGYRRTAAQPGDAAGAPAAEAEPAGKKTSSRTKQTTAARKTSSRSAGTKKAASGTGKKTASTRAKKPAASAAEKK